MISVLATQFILAAAFLPQQDAHTFQRWQVDSSRSTVGFDATSTLHDFSGSCGKVYGGVHANLDSLGRTAGGSIWCEASALDTDEDGRDENMREDLDVLNFPTIDFTISSLNGVLESGSGQAQLAGSFRIHGIEKSRTLTATITSTPNGELHVEGRVRFPMTDHGITPHSVMGMVKVGDEVEAWFDLYLTPVEGTTQNFHSIPLQVEETLYLPGSDAKTNTFATTLFNSGDSYFFDFEGNRSMTINGELRQINLGSLEIAESWGSNDDGFEDSRKRMERLQAKYDKLPASKREKAGARLQATLQRMEESLALAPPEDATVEVVSDERQTILRIGNRDWVVFEGLMGDSPVPSLFSTFSDLPAAVQDALRKLKGTPEKVTVHSATASGSRDIVFRFGTQVEQSLPAWNLQPESWPQTERHTP